MPSGIGIIDTMMGTRAGTAASRQAYAFLQPQLKDAQSRRMEMPAEYLFKDVPHRGDDPPQGAELLLPAMDRNGVERALISVSNADAEKALRNHPTGSSPARSSTRTAAWRAYVTSCAPMRRGAFAPSPCSPRD